MVAFFAFTLPTGGHPADAAWSSSAHAASEPGALASRIGYRLRPAFA